MYEPSFAVVEDAPQIVAFAFKTYKEVDLDTAHPDIEKISIKVVDTINTEVAIVVRDPEDSKKLLACILFEKASTWWSEEVILNQLFVYVKEEFRCEGLFALLLDEVEKYAKMVGINVGQEIVGSSHDVKGKILEKHGYKKIGTSYLLKHSKDTK